MFMNSDMLMTSLVQLGGCGVSKYLMERKTERDRDRENNAC